MKKEVKLNYFIIVIILLMTLEGILTGIFLKRNKVDTSMCAKAVCNEDNSLCYVYDLDETGHTIIKWKGSCQK